MASETPSPEGLSPPRRFPLAVYGRFVAGAKEDVSGWRLIREVEIPAQGHRRPHYGEAVAFVRDTSLGYAMAAAPDLLAALRAMLVRASGLGMASGCYPDEFEKFPEVEAARAAIAKAEGRS